MTKKTCTICALPMQPEQTTSEEFCQHCQALIEKIRKNPVVLDQLCQAVQKERLVHQPIPEVLDGIRYRTVDRDNNTWYVSVSEMEGKPVELFASSAFENEHQLQSKLSNLTSITRLISLILRHIFAGEQLSLSKVLAQLQRSSRQPNDIPEMLAKILANYNQANEKSEQEEEILP